MEKFPGDFDFVFNAEKILDNACSGNVLQMRIFRSRKIKGISKVKQLES